MNCLFSRIRSPSCFTWKLQLPSLSFSVKFQPRPPRPPASLASVLPSSSPPPTDCAALAPPPGFGDTDGGRGVVRRDGVLLDCCHCRQAFLLSLGQSPNALAFMGCFVGSLEISLRTDFALTIPRCGRGPLVGRLSPQTSLSESLCVWVLSHPGGQTLHWAFRTPAASSPAAPSPPRGAGQLWGSLP